MDDVDGSNTATPSAQWPAFMRTASTEHIDIVHPAPDLNICPEGAICRNVERLEKSAEELSESGSDIGDGIRRLHQEQRREEQSRRSSLASLHSLSCRQQQPPAASTTRSRGASTSSYSNSIVDLNREARWGGYSPNAFIGSPAQSFHSGSWAQPAVLQRSASNAMSTSTRPEPVQEGRPLDSPIASPPIVDRQASQSSLSRSVSIQSSIQPSRRSSHASKRSSMGSVKSVTSQKRIPSSLDQEIILVQDQQEMDIPQGDTHDAGSIMQSAPSYRGSDRTSINQPERPGSSDTYRQANVLFQDFDGVHFSPTHEEFVETDQYGNEVRRIPLDEAASMLMQHPELVNPRLSQHVNFAPPPPPEHMVYYPAPVPRMLNLPKKLSNKPTPAAVAQRKSQMMMQPPVPMRKVPSQPQIPSFGFERSRKSETLLPYNINEGDEAGSPGIGLIQSASPIRSPPPEIAHSSSMATLARMPNNMPPQLRAALFFDQSAARQSVHIQHESAVATLDSILEASANAPVNVFTDHPFAGALGGEVYGRERPQRKKRNTISSPHLIGEARNSVQALADILPKEQPKSERRRSISGILGMGNDDSRQKLERRGSVMSMFTDLGNAEGNKLQKRNSRHSLNSENMLNRDGVPSRPASPSPSAILSRAEYLKEREFEIDHAGEAPVEDEYEDEDDEEEYDPDMGPVFAQPTTLLAELQVRKAQQKSRTRTAANAFPNGMHSTLLQLDAVAQIEEKKRKKHKITLAWEDPALRENEDEEPDEDVPLAVLYPTKSGKARKKPGESDWDRPLGLIERRHLEDSEPLSSRRNRILGINPSRANLLAATSSRTSLSSPHSGVPSGQPSPGVAVEEDPDEDISLAERKRRMAQKAALDSALGDVVTKDNKSTFEAEILSVMGVDTSKPEPSPTENKENQYLEDETLGQRRARLQREKSGLDQQQSDRRQSMSMANLLAAAPLNAPVSDRDFARRLASSPAPGTLLHGAEEARTKAKEEMRVRNARTSSYMDMRGASAPSFDPAQGTQVESRGLLGLQEEEKAKRGRRASQGLQQQQQQQLMPSQSMPVGMNGMYAQQMGMGMNMGMGLGLGQQGMAMNQGMGLGLGGMNMGMAGHKGQMMNPLAYQPFVPPAPQTGMGFSGGMAAPPGGFGAPMMGMGMHGVNMGMGMNGLPVGYNPIMGYGMGMQHELLGMDPAQRDNIDRWRSGVAQ